jgi:hypothetical protein
LREFFILVILIIFQVLVIFFINFVIFLLFFVDISPAKIHQAKTKGKKLSFTSILKKLK